MSARADVLAVMLADQVDAIPKREAFQGGKYLAELNAKSEEARAAVAELIEADKEFDTAFHAWAAEKTNRTALQALADAADVRAVALARVGGA